jgi:hypothetical protein
MLNDFVLSHQSQLDHRVSMIVITYLYCSLAISSFRLQRRELLNALACIRDRAGCFCFIYGRIVTQTRHVTETWLGSGSCTYLGREGGLNWRLRSSTLGCEYSRDLAVEEARIDQ